MTNVDRQTRAAPKIAFWLWICALLVFGMILVGGATRLTDSGLSITEWQPVMGALPPWTEADWQLLFEKYKQTDEFKLQNSAMTLSEFKVIFWWEWAHRFLGRAIGVAFALPLLGFLVLRRLTAGLFLRLAGIFVLGGGQGALGWYMVKSGLVGRVDVSQYRLAAHLTLAAIIFGAITWVALGLRHERGRLRGWNGVLALILVALVYLQIAAGGLVAGLDAGLGYTTWPKMDGQWIPSGLLIMEPAWRNFFENAMTVQFAHRLIAYLIFLLAIVHAWQSCTLASLALIYAVITQAAIGIFTLLFMVPLPLGLAHQGGAIVVLFAAIYNLHRQMRVPDRAFAAPAPLMVG